MVEAHYVLIYLFCVCEFFERITNAFSGIDNVIGQFDWYLFPNGMNRMLPTLLMMTQRPVECKSFGITCSRETCKNVKSTQNYSLIPEILVQNRVFFSTY